MNADQRAQLDVAITRLEEAKNIVEAIAGEEQDKFDHLSEKSQEGPNGQKLQDSIFPLEEALGQIEDVIDAIGTVRNG